MKVSHRWRAYETPSGRRPVRDFLDMVSETKSYRLLFAAEGAKGRVLLALEAFAKTTKKTPARQIALAERRLADWRARAVKRR